MDKSCQTGKFEALTFDQFSVSYSLLQHFRQKVVLKTFCWKSKVSTKLFQHAYRCLAWALHCDFVWAKWATNFQTNLRFGYEHFAALWLVHFRVPIRSSANWLKSRQCNRSKLLLSIADNGLCLCIRIQAPTRSVKTKVPKFQNFKKKKVDISSGSLAFCLDLELSIRLRLTK